jgi:hypothetical protein
MWPIRGRSRLRRAVSGEERASAIMTAAAKALKKRSIEGRQMLIVHVRHLV